MTDITAKQVDGKVTITSSYSSLGTSDPDVRSRSVEVDLPAVVPEGAGAAPKSAPSAHPEPDELSG